MRAIGLVAGLALIVGLAAKAESNDVYAGTLTHRNGLVVVLPTPMSVEPTETGYRLSPVDGHMLRSPWSIEVLLDDGPVPADGSLGRLRADDIEFPYKVDRFDGGSGGTEYVLNAWKALDAGHILLIQSEQTEFGQPDFALGWSILASAEKR